MSNVENSNDPIVVLMTFPDNQVAVDVVGALVRDGLAACGNIVPKIRSIYLWEGEVQDDAEALALVKTTLGRFPELQETVVQQHPYDVPEILALPLADGLPAYLEWLTDCVAPTGKTGLETPGA